MFIVPNENMKVHRKLNIYSTLADKIDGKKVKYHYEFGKLRYLIKETGVKGVVNCWGEYIPDESIKSNYGFRGLEKLFIVYFNTATDTWYDFVKMLHDRFDGETKVNAFGDVIIFPNEMMTFLDGYFMISVAKNEYKAMLYEQHKTFTAGTIIFADKDDFALMGKRAVFIHDVDSMPAISDYKMTIKNMTKWSIPDIMNGCMTKIPCGLFDVTVTCSD